jgi:hypothetical protein
MAQASGANGNEFRVTATSMEKVVNKIQAKKQSRKLGRYPVSNIFRIQPSTRQFENAEKIAAQSNSKKMSEKLNSVSIPMFSAKGLAIKRPTGEIVTPFYFSYEDLKDDWTKLSGQAQGKLVVNVHDFSEVMLLAKGVSAAPLGADGNAAMAADLSADMSANQLSISDVQAAVMSPAVSKYIHIQ